TPTPCQAPPPQDGVSTNSTTSACKSVECYSLAITLGHCQWLSRPWTSSYCACFGGSTGWAGASCVGAGVASGAGAGGAAGGAADSGAGTGAGAVSVTGGRALSLIDESWPPLDDR